MRRIATAILVALAVVARSGEAADPHRHVSQYVHRHYGAREGLPHNLSNSLAQLPDGYLWAGTEQGLARYDGQRFVTFDRDGGLPANTISALATSAGVLWIGTRDRGLVERDASGRFHALGLPELGNQIRTIALDAAGDLWVGTRSQGAARVHAGEIVEQYVTRGGLPSDDVRALKVTTGGDVWIGTFNGAARITAGHVQTIQELAGTAVLAIVEDRRHDLWFATARGLWRRSASGLVQIDDRAATALLFDRDDNLWIGGPRGLVRRSLDGHEEALDLDARILALLEDRQGDLWIAHEDGLDELVDNDVLPLGRAEGLTDEAIYGVLEDHEGAIWAAAADGVYRKPVAGAATNVGPEHGTVYSLYEAADGVVWAGARDGSVGCWRAGRFTWQWTGNWEKVRTITRAPDGLWLGTDHGLARVVGEDFAAATMVVAGPIVSAIAIDGSGLWLGTEGSGLRHVTPSGAAIPIEPGGPSASSSVVVLVTDPDGSLWAGTEGEGLWHLHDHRWTSITRNEGLFDDLVWSIVDDHRDSIWMSSNRGIWRVPRTSVRALEDRKDARIASIVYGEADGMRKAECDGAVTPPAWITRAGTLLFPTAQGLATIDPDHLHRMSPQPAILEAAAIDGRPTDLAGELRMPAGASRLDIAYTVAELRVPERARFRYKLEPFDTTWQDAGVERIAHYTNLDHGRYVFHVEVGVDGEWSPPTTLALRLEPRFYQTPWFLVLATLAGVAVVLTIPLLRVRQLKQRERELAERVQEAVREVKTLTGLIPICAWCKKIRDDQGLWNRLEQYFSTRTEAKFTHGICPTCAQKQMDEDA